MSFEGLWSATVESVAEGAVRLRAGDATIEVAALAGDLFRVGVFPRGKPPRYASDAVAKDDWPDAGAEWTGSELRTPEATAHVQLDPLRISFSDGSGRRFAADDPGVAIDTGAGAFGVEDRIGPAITLTKAREPGERYFGCGERTAGL